MLKLIIFFFIISATLSYCNLRYAKLKGADLEDDNLAYLRLHKKIK
jgi:uncharacterized protein YjbI with pentapeptide repeats